MSFDKNRIIKLLIIMALPISLLIVVIFAQKQQEIRSRASPQDLYNAFELTDNTGNPLEYKDENDVRTYETKSLDVKIKVIDLQKLIGDGR